MDPTYSAEAEQYRRHIRDFLARELPDDWAGVGSLPASERGPWLRKWRDTMRDNKLLAVSWPEEYGGAGLSALEQVILSEEFAIARVPTSTGNDGFGIGMVGPTIIVWGTDEQKRHFLPKIISGEHKWCQGYSEPSAGSDLAGLGTRAELDGEEWIINGQKIWTSQAHTANWIFVLTRTAPDNPKHKGITFLLVPMEQPGIEVRPIREATGESLFNEVFFTDARSPKANVVGAVNEGWTVANTLLGFERGGSATTRALNHRRELDRVIALAQAQGKTGDQRVRDRLAWCHERVEILRFLSLRSLTSSLAGTNPGADASVFKLMWSEYHQELTNFVLDLLGPDALVLAGSEAMSSIAPSDDNITSRSAVTQFIGARAGTIYAGSSQVQRNIIGERVLGLPKEPRADSGPWKDLAKQ